MTDTAFVTPDDIEAFFDRYGWTFSRARDEMWRTGFRGEVSSFNISVQLTENWLFLAINPLVVKPDQTGPEGDSQRLHLYHHLLRLNHEINLAKFGIDADGDVFLAVEIPTEGLQYSDFEDALGALSHYADRHYRDLFLLAHGDAAANDFSNELDTPDEVDDTTGDHPADDPPADDYPNDLP